MATHSAEILSKHLFLFANPPNYKSDAACNADLLIFLSG